MFVYIVVFCFFVGVKALLALFEVEGLCYASFMWVVELVFFVVIS